MPGPVDTMSPLSIRLDAAGAVLNGDLTIPADARGLVLFAHGSGSSRHSRRNRAVAETELDILHTLTSFEVYDMLAGTTRSEAETAQLVARLVRNELRVSAAPATPARRPRRGRLRQSSRNACD